MLRHFKGAHAGLAYILELLHMQHSLWVALNADDVVLLTWVLSSWHPPHFIKHQFVISLKWWFIWSFFLWKNNLIHRFSRKGAATEVKNQKYLVLFY